MGRAAKRQKKISFAERCTIKIDSSSEKDETRSFRRLRIVLKLPEGSLLKETFHEVLLLLLVVGGVP